MHSRISLIPLFLSFALLAYSAPSEPPLVLAHEGRLLGVAADVDGGLSVPTFSNGFIQPGLSPMIITFSPEGNQDLIGQVISDMTTSLVDDPLWWVHAMAGGGSSSSIAGQQISFSSPGATGISLPALDASSHDAATMQAYFPITGIQQNGYVAPSSSELSTAQRQKAWLNSNFKLKIDGLDKTVNKVGAITVSQGAADLDGDGIPDLVCSDISIEMGAASAQEFSDWFQSSLKGKPITKTLSVTVTDSFGNRLFSITAEVQPVGFGPSDPMSPSGAAAAYTAKFTKSGHVTLLK